MGEKGYLVKTQHCYACGPEYAMGFLFHKDPTLEWLTFIPQNKIKFRNTKRIGPNIWGYSEQDFS